MNKKIYPVLLLMIFFSITLFGQDDLLELLNEQVGDTTLPVEATFKSTHIINSHSVERMKAHQLDFRINHRFGEINQGAYYLWGLDNALVSFDFGYGINDWLMVGFRRSTYKKLYDGSLKFSLWRQTTGSRNFPVSISYYTNMGINTLKEQETNFPFQHRLSFTHQVLIARKFNDHISLQLMPTYVHRNLVDFNDVNDIYSVGFGGRFKFHRRVALTFEYFWASHTASNPKYYNPLSLGIDIETGGHVFQLFVTNSRIMEESGFIGETTGSWLDGGIYFGFNISRVFALGKHKE
jgi:hypothetical protein